MEYGYTCSLFLNENYRTYLKVILFRIKTNKYIFFITIQLLDIP